MDEQANVEIPTPIGPFKARGADLITLLTLVIVLVLGGFIYAHASETKTERATLLVVLTNILDAQKEHAKQQTLLTCIISRPPVEQKREFESPNSFCHQIARI